MQHYEMMYIVDPSSEEVQEDVKKRIEGTITGREGMVLSFEKLGKKRLAYPIAKNPYGIYFLVNLQGDGKIVQALDYLLRLNPNVIRHIILNFSEKHLRMRAETIEIQKEEAERMRRGGRPLEQMGKGEAAPKKVTDADSTGPKEASTDKKPVIESEAEVKKATGDEKAESVQTDAADVKVEAEKSEAESKPEEAKTEDLKAEEPAKEVASKEDTGKEVSSKDDAGDEDASKEAKTEDLKVEEPATDDTVKEDASKEDAGEEVKSSEEKSKEDDDKSTDKAEESSKDEAESESVNAKTESDDVDEKKGNNGVNDG